MHAGILDGTAHFPEAARWMRNVERLGEPWTFGLRPEEAAGFLAARRLLLVRDESTAEAGARLFPGVGRHERASALYRVAVARFGGASVAAHH